MELYFERTSFMETIRAFMETIRAFMGYDSNGMHKCAKFIGCIAKKLL
jgi:hypothetical protein